MGKEYKILSFDGGGIRGVYTAKLLSMLHKEKPFIDQIDLFVGTSTGAISALTLAASYDPDTILEIYKNFGSASFVPYDFEEKAEGARPKYQNKALKDLILQHVFPGNPKLSDLQKKVLIPAFKLYNENKKRWAPHCFHNIEDQKESPYVVDVLLASGAAPIYFPSYNGYIDGGVFANNPSMLAACKALGLEDDVKQAEEVTLFSIGTGDMLNGIQEDADFGSHGWFVKSPKSVPDHPFFSIVSDGINDVPHYMCKQILRDKYYRLNTPFKSPIAIDQHDKIEELLEEANRVPEDFKKEWDASLSFIEAKILS